MNKEEALSLLDDLLYLIDRHAWYPLQEHDKRELEFRKSLPYCDCCPDNLKHLCNNLYTIGKRLGMGFVDE